MVIHVLHLGVKKETHKNGLSRFRILASIFICSLSCSLSQGTQIIFIVDNGNCFEYSNSVTLKFDKWS